MSRLRADSLVNYSGSGTPNFKSGVTGAAVTFTGDVTAANGSFTGNVTIDGNLTYKDVTNVDSVGIITAQEGIQVSANGVNVTGVGTFNNPITVAGIATINGGGLNVVGVITATSYSGDGSSLSGISPAVSAVASGTLANGQTVILQSDGTVTGVASTAPNFNITAFQSSNAVRHVNAAYVGSNKVVIAFEDQPSGSRGAAVVGTISGSSISFGTVVEFDSSYSYNTGIVYDSDNDKVVIVYRDSGSSNYSKAIVGTVSGTSISFGSPVVFGGNTYTNIPIRAVFDSSNNKVVVVYQDANNSNYGTARVGTVSGNSISFGSAVVFESAAVGNWISAAFDSTNNKVVIAYDDGGNSNYGTAIVGTVSGTSISFGTAVVFESASIYYHHMAFDSTNDKVIIAYRDDGNSNYGTAIVGTVSGTSISFGSPVVFESGRADYNSVAYDSTNDKVVIAYQDNPNNGYGTVIRGTVSGTSISFDTPHVFHSDSTEWNSIAYDSDNSKLVVAYRDNENDRGEATVIDSTTLISTNLTSSNFLGFSDAAYTNGQTATIQIAGAVDDAQSGLTTASVHYVQNDGTLSTTAGSPSVEAGLALSATEIAIKA
jgi:hypothetical protein